MEIMRDRVALKGIVLVGTSACIYGVSPALMKITFSFGGNGLLSTFYTSIFALPFLAFWSYLTHGTLRTDAKTVKKLIVLSFGTWPTSILLYSSYSYIPVGMSTTLHYIYPIAIALFLRLFFRERLSWHHLVSLLFAFSGILCIGAANLAEGSLTGILLAISSGLTWGFYMVYLEKSGLKELRPEILHFYMAAANAIAAGTVCLLTQGKIGGYTLPAVWALVVVNGFLHRVAGNAMLSMGIRYTNAITAGIVSTFEPVVSVLIGTVFLHEKMNLLQGIGLVLVLTGICFVVCKGIGRR